MTSTWRDVIAQFPEAVEPLYNMTRPNTPVELFQGRIVILQDGDTTVDESGRLLVFWLPSPRISFETSVPPPNLNESLAVVEIPDLNASFSAIITNIGGSGALCKGVVQPPVVVGPRNNCQEIIFQVTNAHPFIGERIRNKEFTVYGQAVLN